MTAPLVTARASPLIISFPHVGTDIPDTIAARMTPEALRLDDTDFEQPALAIQAVYPPQRHLSARVRKFIDHLVQYFADFH